MLVLPLDEAFCFDYLAILKVKSDHTPELEQNFTNYIRYFNVIKAQLSNFEEILASKEFLDLLDANSRVFHTIEHIRKGLIGMFARELDKLNEDRFIAKRALQKKFFEKPLNEYKTSTNM